MHGNMSCRGAKHRFLILMYLTCFILSLAPTIVAPPERGFSQGQPEMQQSMDNMVAHGTIMKKSMTIPPTGATDYPAMLTSKTSSLLSEAEQVLNSLKDSKEKQWIESFVHRMRAIADMLEKTAQNSKQALPKTLNPMSGTPVPEGLPLQPTLPGTSAVPEFNPFQKPSRMVSKFPVTSPELSQVLPVNEYPSERQVVTKPAVLSNKKEDAEDDELVRELESLHQEIAPQVPFQSSKTQEESAIVTSAATPVTVKSDSENVNDMEMRKDALKARLIQEITQLQHLGGSIPKEVINALNGNNQKISDLAYKQKAQADENNLSENTPNGMVDKVAQMLDDFKNEDDEISKTNNLNSEKSKSYQDEKHLQQTILNHTLQNTHLHMPVFPKQMGNPHFSSQNREQIYQKGLQNAIQDLQRPNPFNFHGRYPTFGSTSNQQVGQVPDALKQRMLKPENMVYNGYPAAPGYNEYLARNGYGPYPYMHQWDHKNSTFHLPPGMSPYLIRPSMNHQIDTQLSDEMKRQLRDGKIVVLSDSVVRSNFEQNEEGKSGENGNNEAKPENVNEKKNATETPN